MFSLSVPLSEVIVTKLSYLLRKLVDLSVGMLETFEIMQQSTLNKGLLISRHFSGRIYIIALCLKV